MKNKNSNKINDRVIKERESVMRSYNCYCNWMLLLNLYKKVEYNIPRYYFLFFKRKLFPNIHPTVKYM